MPHDDWSPLDAAVLKDQREAYDRMRAKCPVAHSSLMGWSLFRHADVVAVLDDPATFSNASRFLAIPNGLNPPVHGPYNTAVGSFFSKERMAELEPRARRIAVQLLEPLRAGGQPEFVAAFITPFMLRTQCAMLGWPEEEWDFLAGWIHGNQQVALSGDHTTGKMLAERFAAQVRTNLEAHRKNLQASDATAGLLQAEVEGRRFSEEEIVSILRNWVAGQGTAVDALSIVLLHLAQAPDLQERLRNTPALIPAAIEEILRMDGPLIANRRTTTRAVELQGQAIAEGATLSLMWIAANRDPLAFPAPDVIDLDRDTGPSLTWGKGIHLCLGAPLARLEIRVAIEELLARTVLIELASAQPPRKVHPGNGFAALPLRLK